MKLLILFAAALTLTSCQPPKSEQQKNAEQAVGPLLGDTKKTPVSDLPINELDNADGLPLALKETCAENLCGAPPARDTAKEAASAAAAAPMIADLTTLAEESIYKDAADIEFVNAKLASSRKLPTTQAVSPRQMAIMNLLWSLRFFPKIQSAWDGVSFDHSITSQNLSSELTDSEIRWIEEMLTAFINSDARTQANKIEMFGLKSFFEEETKSTDEQILKTAMKQSAASILQRADAIEKEFPSLIEIKPGVAAIARGEDVDEKGVADFAAGLRSVVVDQIYTKQLNLFTKSSLNLDKEADYFATKTLPVYRVYNKATAVAARAAKRIETCTGVAAHIAQVRTKTQAAAANLKSLVEAIRPSVISVALSFTNDEDTTTKIREQLTNLRFVLPDSPDRALEKIKDEMRGERTVRKATFELIKNGDVQTLQFYMVMMNTQADRKLPQPGKVCTDHDPLYLSDAAYSSLGAVKISWSTLTDPSLAAPVIAHEFGHIVSSAFRKIAKAKKDKSETDYARTYQCVVDRKTSVTPQAKTQEEDFADLFSGRVMNVIETTGAKYKPLGCTLMATFGTDGRWDSRQGLSMVWPANIEMDHSTELYRTIQNEINRGHQLPESCESIVQQSYHLMNNRCQ